jgi:hypothetical protein
MVDVGKHFDYVVTNVDDLRFETKQNPKTGRPLVSAVLVQDERLKPTDRFWTSLFARYGINSSYFRYFDYPEVFSRISQVESKDRLRLCVERDQQKETGRLLAASSPDKPLVAFDDLMGTLSRYQEDGGVSYADGVVESSHTPRIGSNTFQVAGDDFSNRFVLCTPIDGYGLPAIYLSLLRIICENGAVGYARAFRTTLALGKASEDVTFSITRALEGFGNDEGYGALRQRFESAAKSWASVSESQNLYRELVRLHHQEQIGWDGAALIGESGIAKAIRGDNQEMSALTDRREESRNPILTAFTGICGEPCQLYGLSNLDALSDKRQRTLPVKCRVLDLLNFATEVATHHATESGSRSCQAWLGSLIGGEYDLEDSCGSFGEFQDFFLDRRLNGEVALDLQDVRR